MASHVHYFRHVSSAERAHGKRYRNMASVFSIGEESDEEGDSGDEPSSPNAAGSEQLRERVKLATWLKAQPDLVAQFECQQLDDKTYLYPTYVG